MTKTEQQELLYTCQHLEGEECITLQEIKRLVMEISCISGVTVNIYVQYINDVKNSILDHVNINETIKTKNTRP